MQTLLHEIHPGSHGTHRPEMQIAPPPQLLPQVPQLSGEALSSRHVLPQKVSPMGQVIVQTPTRHS